MSSVVQYTAEPKLDQEDLPTRPPTAEPQFTQEPSPSPPQHLDITHQQTVQFFPTTHPPTTGYASEKEHPNLDHPPCLLPPQTSQTSDNKCQPDVTLLPVPELYDGNAVAPTPPLTEVTTPPLTEVTTPPLTEVTTPPLTEVPPVAVTEIPPVAVTEVPPVAASEVPSVAVTEVPPVAASEVPPVAVTEVPPEAVSEVPSVAVSEVPPVAVTEVPPVAVTEVPPVAVTEVPPEAVSEVPPVVASEVPTAAVSEVPSVAVTEAPPVAVTELPPVAASEVPSVAVTELPSVAVSEVPPVAVSEVPPVAASEVPSVAVSEVPSVAVSEVPPEAVSEVPPVVASEVPSAAVSEVPPTAAVREESAEVARESEACPIEGVEEIPKKCIDEGIQEGLEKSGEAEVVDGPKEVRHEISREKSLEGGVIEPSVEATLAAPMSAVVEVATALIESSEIKGDDVAEEQAVEKAEPDGVGAEDSGPLLRTEEETFSAETNEVVQSSEAEKNISTEEVVEKQVEGGQLRSFEKPSEVAEETGPRTAEGASEAPAEATETPSSVIRAETAEMNVANEDSVMTSSVEKSGSVENVGGMESGSVENVGGMESGSVDNVGGKEVGTGLNVSEGSTPEGTQTPGKLSESLTTRPPTAEGAASSTPVRVSEKESRVETKERIVGEMKAAEGATRTLGKSGEVAMRKVGSGVGKIRVLEDEGPHGERRSIFVSMPGESFADAAAGRPFSSPRGRTTFESSPRAAAVSASALRPGGVSSGTTASVFESQAVPSTSDASAFVTTPRLQLRSVFESQPCPSLADITASAPAPTSARHQRTLFTSEAKPSTADATAASPLSATSPDRQRTIFTSTAQPSMAAVRHSDSNPPRKAISMYQSVASPSSASVRCTDELPSPSHQRTMFANMPAPSSADVRANDPPPIQTSSGMYENKPSAPTSLTHWSDKLDEIQRPKHEPAPESSNIESSQLSDEMAVKVQGKLDTSIPKASTADVLGSNERGFAVSKADSDTSSLSECLVAATTTADDL